jgi:uncharacterized membrane protein YgcG
MSFPIVGYYQLNFRHSDTGLTPVFDNFRRIDTGATVLPLPDIIEDGNGRYHFTHVWQAEDDPDISYEVDGGPSIPVEVVRYVNAVISVRAYVTASGGGGGGSSGGGGGNYHVG